jgi:hypothetical protein
METATLRVIVDFAKKREEEMGVEAERMSLGELLYWVMFGEGKREAVGAA